MTAGAPSRRLRPLALLAAVAVMGALTAAAAVRHPGRPSEPPTVPSATPSWHDGYDHYIVTLPVKPTVTLRSAVLRPADACPAPPGPGQPEPWQAAPPDPRYKAIWRPGQPMSALYAAIRALPRGYSLQRDCNGDIRAVPPGAPTGAGAVATVPAASPGPVVGAQGRPAFADEVAAKLRAVSGVKSVQVVGGRYLVVKAHLRAAEVASVTGGAVTDQQLFAALGTPGTTTEPPLPNDPLFSDAYFLADWGQGGVGSLSNGVGGLPSTPGASADAAQAWPYSTGAGVLVAVIDGGVNTTSTELLGRISPLSRNFLVTPPSTDIAPAQSSEPAWQHGQWTSVTLSGNLGNGSGAAGVAPNAQVMQLVCMSPTTGTLTDQCIYQAGEYAIANGAKVINMSFGAGYATGADPLLTQLVTDADSAGVLVVAAAGNSAQDNDTYPFYPADYAKTFPNVISVGASDMQDNAATFSDYGANSVDVFAPGVLVLTQDVSGAPDFWSGTSAAAPIVSGTAALLLSEDPALTPSEVRSIIMTTADHPAALAGLSISGGRVDAAAAVASVAPPVQMTVSGVGALAPSVPGTVSINALLTSPALTSTASSLSITAQLVYDYSGQAYAVVGMPLSWSGPGQSGKASTDGTGTAVLSPGGFPAADFTGTGVTVSFPLSLPVGNYALVLSLVNPAGGASIGNHQAVFFTVTGTGPAATTTVAPGATTTAPAATSSSTTAPALPGTTVPGTTVPSAPTSAPSTTLPGATTTAPAATSSSTTAPALPGTTLPGTTLPSAPTSAPSTTVPGATTTSAPAATTTVPAVTTTQTTLPPGPAEPSQPTANFGITQLTPNVLGPAGGDVTVFGSKLPANAVVRVGTTYEAVTNQGAGSLDVTVGALLPGLYSLTVLNQGMTLSDTLANAIEVTTGTGGTLPGGPSSSTTAPAASTTVAPPPPIVAPASTTTPGSGGGPTTAPAATTTTAPGPATTGTGMTTTSAPVGTTAPQSSTTVATVPSTTSTNPPAATTTTPTGQPFQAPNGLTIALLSSGSPVASVPPGSWSSLLCQGASCTATTLTA